MNNEPISSDNNDIEIGVGRVEAFSDGVFAVAVTLLVLNIQVPHVADAAGANGLIDNLLKQWPAYLSYFMTFITIGAVWISHHQLLKYLQGVDSTFQHINILFLMMLTLAPFTTGLLAEYLHNNEQLRVAVTIYGGGWFITGLFMNAMWYYAQNNDLLKVTVSSETRQTASREYAFGTLMGFVGVCIGLLSPIISVAIYILVAVIYTLPVFRLFIPKKI